MSDTRRLAILLVLPVSPLPIFSGGRQRMFQMLKQLAPCHDWTVLSFWRDEEARLGLEELADMLDIEVIPVPFQRPGLTRHLPAALKRRVQAWYGSLPADVYLWDQSVMHDAIKRVIATKRIDLIQVEWPYLATYALAQPKLPSLLITHDIFSVALQRRADVVDSFRQRRYLQKQALAWERYESAIYSGCSVVAAMSDADAEMIQNRAPSATVVVLPNGVDAHNIIPGEIRQQAKHLLFVGSPTHPPNLDAACWLLKDIWPDLKQQNPGLKLTLINLDHPQVRSCLQPGVELTGRLPDLAPVYRQADIAIVPLRAGSGTRLKILEAFAYGVPVVSTTVGYEGIDVVPGEHLLVADTGGDFVAALDRLVKDWPLRQRLATAGRQLVETKYDWSHIAARQQTVFFELMQKEDGHT